LESLSATNSSVSLIRRRFRINAAGEREREKEKYDQMNETYASVEPAAQ